MVLVKVKDATEAGHLHRVSCGELKEWIKHCRETSTSSVLGVR